MTSGSKGKGLWSERALIESIAQRAQGTSLGLQLGIGDDAAVIEPTDRLLVVSCDCLVEGVHFRWDWTSALQLGRKSVAVNLSDLAAMGAAAFQGAGEMGHLDATTLWVQQAAGTGRLELGKVKGIEGPVGLFTEDVPTTSKLGQLVGLFGGEFRGGRADAASMTRGDILTRDNVADVHATEGRPEECNYPLVCRTISR